MKAEELMIGDWVHYRGTNIQVTSLYDKGGSNEIGWSDKESVWVNGSNVEPIPLTPEILEKNGFVESKEKSNIEDIGCAIIYGKYKRFDSDNCLNYGDSLYPIKYVHQLQHAMKLCGINKEIVL
jgi:hypothetical protein